jgi:serine phosphatase RsbU (regulator of sigma subunit)
VTLPEEDEPEYERTRAYVVSRKPSVEPTPVSDTLGHYLVVLEGSAPGRRLEISSELLTVGRGAKQTLVVDDPDVSRVHLRVSLVAGDVVAEDMNSTNGTFVDGRQIKGTVKLTDGNVLRMGGQVIKYERRSRQDVRRSEELDRDIRKASDYVWSLLPAPIGNGQVLAEWRFVPSTHLGGDAFGYYWLDASTFVFYLIDVSGHGVGAAMHSVTVLDVLRQRALPRVDFKNPAEVLSSLNSRFPMDSYNGLYFTMWYGVYNASARTLAYGSAGHHPAFLVTIDKHEAQPLGMPALMIGILPDQAYEVQESVVPPGSRLFLFSDGAYEIVTKDQQRWSLSEFLPLLLEPAVPGQPETERVYRRVREAAASGPLEDDFSLVAVTFP